MPVRIKSRVAEYHERITRPQHGGRVRQRGRGEESVRLEEQYSHVLVYNRRVYAVGSQHLQGVDNGPALGAVLLSLYYLLELGSAQFQHELCLLEDFQEAVRTFQVVVHAAGVVLRSVSVPVEYRLVNHESVCHPAVLDVGFYSLIGHVHVVVYAGHDVLRYDISVPPAGGCRKYGTGYTEEYHAGLSAHIFSVTGFNAQI
ncbi:unknown [Alistipes sp. CAG:831]|nr:unknown [Alistipes sp. CAG:831]